MSSLSWSRVPGAASRRPYSAHLLAATAAVVALGGAAGLAQQSLEAFASPLAHGSRGGVGLRGAVTLRGGLEAPTRSLAAAAGEAPISTIWQTSLVALGRCLTVASIVTLLTVSAAMPVLAKGEATGFAEYAAKGGTMAADPACFVTSCGQETKECFVEDGRCLKGALCLARCRGDPDCATQCFAEFGCPRLDRWLKCTVETKQCVSVPEGTYDVKKFYETDVPTKLRDFDVNRLDGVWYKVRGYNPKYDCYPCQTNKFKYDAASNTMETEVKLRLERKKSGGYWQNKLTEKMSVSAPQDRSTLVAKGEIFGLSFQEEWYVLGAEDDFVLVAYTGNNLQDAYKGSYVYARTPQLSPEVEAKARAVAEKNGYEWSKYCIIDNTCPAQAEADYSKSVTLSMDDLPDLIEWFAPGTTRGGTKKDANFKGAY